MKTIFSFLIGITFCLTSITTLGQNIEWATRVITHAYGELGITTLPDGNVVICGTYLDSCIIGDYVLNGYSTGSYSYSGVFIAKVNASGNLLWVNSIADSSNVNAYKLTHDLEGNIYVAGRSGVINEAGVSIPEPGAFIAKYSPSGSLIWVTPVSNTGSNNFSFEHIIVSNAGSVYVAGQLSSNVQADIGCGQTLESSGGTNKFIVKYDLTGACQWSQTFTASYLGNIDVDGDDNLYLTGSFSDEASFGSIFHVSNGNHDVYLAKCNSDGSWDWAINAGSSSGDYGQGVAVANNGVFLIGNFRDTISFGCGESISTGAADIFLSYLDGSGNCLWSKQMGGGHGNQYGYDIVVDQLGNCIVTGSIIDTTFFDGITVVPSSENAFYAKYDATGNCNWAFGTGGRSCRGTGLGIDSSENIYSVGRLFGYGDFSFGNHMIEIPNNTSDPFPDPFDYIGGQFLLKFNSSSVSDIRTPERLKNIKVYPNPASDLVNIELASEERNIVLNLYDLRGALLQSNQLFRVKSFNYQLPEANGLYFIQLIGSDGQKSTLKVVKE